MPSRREPERGRYFPMTIIARDPLVKDQAPSNKKRAILRAVIQVPASRLEPGPRGPRFHVVGFDASRRRLDRPATLAPMRGASAGWDYRDRFAMADDSTLLRDPAFHAQNVYAIAARTLGFFEGALGRPVPWAFGSSQLYLVPTAFAEANAYYSDDDRALLFGYFDSQASGPVMTCLAHDIVAHETTHAILDGLRRRFDTPGLPDQAGFHEGFADLVALLSILSARESIEAVLGKPGQARVQASLLTFDGLRDSVLFTIGAQFGNALHLNRGDGLRRSIEQPPTTAWKDLRNPEWAEPHRRGEILVAAVMRTYLHMWTNRLIPIVGSGTIDRGRAAEEGATAAKHLLNMVIRAIDYCPPVEFELADFLTAIVASEAEVNPDDEYGYVEALKDGFKSFGIEVQGAPDWAAPPTGWPTYRDFSYASLRSDPDETFRFIWDHARFLGINPAYYLHVENVRPAVRTGPRGFVVSETVVDYVQELILSRADLDKLAQPTKPGDPPFVLPSTDVIPDRTKLKLWGGGTIIFDEFGAVKYQRVKRLDDWSRQQRRLDYLVNRGLWDTKGRLGFSLGAPLGQRFAEFHRQSPNLAEEW
jgi:hypothetical protein